MITLIRWVLYKQKEVKWKLAFYQFLDQQMKNPEELEKKIVSYLAEIIHKENETKSE